MTNRQQETGKRTGSKWYRMLLVVTVLGALFSFGVLARPQAAHANGPSCSGWGCEGQDPVATGCNVDGTTVRTADAYDAMYGQVAHVELRWSNTCQTNWTRVTATFGVGPQHLHAEVHRTSNDNPQIEDRSDYQQIYTNMVYAPGSCTAYGIGGIYLNSYDSARTACA